MTNDSGTTRRARSAAAGPAPDAPASGRAPEPEPEPAPAPDAEGGRAPTRAAPLAVLALAWLIAMLWVAHSSISSDVGAVALATAASSLPAVVSAAIVAGAAAALVAAGLVGLVGRATGALAGRVGIRFAASVLAGVVTGLAAGSAFIAVSGSDPARMAIGATLAAGATIGAAIAGARPGPIPAAAVAAALAVFATGFTLSLFKGPVQAFYGAGEDEASQLSAAGWFAATAAVASGVAAGLTAYRFLGGARRVPELRWPAYLVAGAGPGFLLLVTEAVIRTGGAKLLGLVREISDADRILHAWAGGSRINNGLVVLFVGALVAIIAFGRTLDPPSHDVDEEPTDGTA
jgi:hypothetical protein